MSSTETHHTFDLDWGPSTVEAINDQRRLALHILNHHIETSASLERTLRFAAGRVQWFSKQLPEGFQQVVLFDDRGQSVPVGTKREIASRLAASGADVLFESEGGLNGLQLPS